MHRFLHRYRLTALVASYLQALAAEWQPKLLLSLTLSAFLEAAQVLLGELLYVKPVLAVGLLLLIVIDFIAGWRAARRRGEATAADAMRKSFDKLTTYLLTIISLAIFANMFIEVPGLGHAASWILNAAFFWAAITEVVSIRGNLTGDREGGRQWLRRLWTAAAKRDVTELIEGGEGEEASTRTP